MDLPESPSPAAPGFAATGRVMFWIGAVFCTIAAPWMLGGQPLAAQWCLLAGSATAFIGGLFLHLSSPSSPGARTAARRQKWALGLGLLFVAYLLVQALNPSLELLSQAKELTLAPVSGAHPGPHSIRAPFESRDADPMPFLNAWRFVLVYGTAWLFAAGLALGLKSRGDVRVWISIAGLNGLSVALVSLVHRALGEKLTLWQFHSLETHAGSPVFLYKNHNGCYLAAALAAILGLAATTEDRRTRRLWEISALLVWLGAVAVNSRAATGFATLWLAVYAVLRFRNARRESEGNGRRWLFASLAAAGVIALFIATDGPTLLRRFRPALSSPVAFVQDREYRGLLREVGLDMWRDDPAWGWGGGAFMYLFSNYEGQVPELRQHVLREQPDLNRLFVSSADCDWVEFLVEYGLVGVGLLGAAALVAGLAWWHWRGWRDGLTLFLFLGAAGIVLHAYFDHILRNPALFLLLAGLGVAMLRLAAPGRHARPSGKSS